MMTFESHLTKGAVSRRVGFLVFVLCGCLALSASATVTTNANSDLVFSGLSAALTYTIPANETATFRRITTTGEKTVTVSGGTNSRLKLMGSGSAYPIDNTASSSSAVGFKFNVPVDLAATDADGGVTVLVLGGSTFTKPVTLTESTKPLSVRRRNAVPLNFDGAGCVVDFSTAAKVEIGQPGTDYKGVKTTVDNGARLSLPETVIGKASYLTVDHSSTVTIDGDLTAPDGTYKSGSTVYAAILKVGHSSSLTCRRFVESKTDGLSASLENSSSFTATDGIELHSLSGKPFFIGTGTIRTPDFNTKGSQPASLLNTLTFDTQDLVTRVGKLVVTNDVTAKRTVSVTGGGSVEFVEPVSLPNLQLAAATTLLFDRVQTTRAPIEVQNLILPESGRAKLKVVNRMISGSATLATGGITQDQLEALDLDIPAGSTLSIEDGDLVFSVEEDLTLPARAVYDTDGWTCYNVRGELLDGTEPNEATTNYTFAANADLSALSGFRLGDGVTLDLEGHSIRLNSEAGFGVTFAVTDSSTGGPGELHLDVPTGSTFDNRLMFLSGNLKLVKEGGGVLRLVRADPFTGGEVIVGGRIEHLTDVVRYEDFGAVGDGVVNDLAAVRAAHERANEFGLPVRAKDGVVYNLGNGKGDIEIRTDVDFGTATFVINDVGAGSGNNIFVVPPSQGEISLTKTLEGLPPPVHGQTDLGVTLPCKCLVQINNSETNQFVRKGENQDDGEYQRDFVIVDANGKIDPSAPFVWNFPTWTSAKGFPIDAKPLTLKGGVFKTIANQEVAGANYYSRGILIKRSNVRIEGLRRVIEGEPEGATSSTPYVGFVTVQEATDVTFEDCVFAGHRIYYKSNGTTSRGSYDVQVKSSVGVTFKNCSQTNSITDTALWGVFTSNYSKKLLFDGCSFSRIDAHHGVGNATVRNSTLGHQGVQAIGFGRLVMENTTITGSSAFINLRNDYGALWHGEFIVRNCTFVPRGTSSGKTLSLITPSNNGKWNFGYDCMMPWRVTIDGLYIDNGNATSLYLFSDPDPENTSADIQRPYPYAVTECVRLRNVTVKDGYDLGLSPNTWMFRNTVVTDFADSMDVDGALEVVSNWNWTNGQYRVDVTQCDVEALNRGDGRLTMTVRDGRGAIVCEQSQTVEDSGPVLFDLDVPAAGAFYSAEVRAYDKWGEIFYAGRASLPERFLGTMGAFWFSAAADGNMSVVTNGDWQAPQPAVSASAYLIDGEATFDIDEPGAEPSQVTVETSWHNATEFWGIGDLPAPDASHISFLAACETTAAADEGASPQWYVACPDANGRNVWTPLVGASPTAGRDSVFRVIIDRTVSPMLACYAVKNEGEEDFVELHAADGAVWLPTLLPDDWMPSQTAFAGRGRVNSLHGEVRDAALAEVGGVRYSDLQEALLAAAASGQPVVFQTDVSLSPRDLQGLSQSVSVRFATDGCRARLVVPSGETLQLAESVGLLDVALVVEPGGQVSLAAGRHKFKSLTVGSVDYLHGTYSATRGPDEVRAVLSGDGAIRVGKPASVILVVR